MSPRTIALLSLLALTLANRNAGAQAPTPAAENPPAPARASTPEAPPATVRAAFGRGATLASGDGSFELNLRGRIQTRFTLGAAVDSAEAPETDFQVRRMRLVFQGHAVHRDLQYYIQLGLSNRDMESDLRIPLRDAYVTWARWPWLQVRAGQMKVPFDRQRVVSSSALQFVDRSIVTSELNLDRDVGVQFYSRDLFGLGDRIGYQLGIFGGDGRNRVSGEHGLLWVARLEFKPFGRFDDYVEGDLERHARPRLSVGLGFAFNENTNRAQSTLGGVYTFGGFDYLHGEFDLAFKWRGLSLLGQAMLRRADAAYRERVAGGTTTREFSRNFFGWFVQAGYLLHERFEVVARYGDLRPTVLDEAMVDRAQRRRREAGGGLNLYFVGHALKLQADYFYYFGETLEDAGEHQARLQLQLFF